MYFVFFRKKMATLHYLTSLVLCSVSTLVLAQQSDDDIMAEYLKDLDFEQMLEIEVSLDDVFDVFDGLIKAEKVSVATGVSQSRQQAPAVTSVLTRQDIEAIGARNIDEILEQVPGLHVGRTSVGGMSTYIIRGIYTSSLNTDILFMINGVSLKSLMSGNRGMDWNGLPVQSIERIEVIRGPGSALYGADAFSGVINVITRQGHDIKGTELGAYLASFNTQGVWAAHGDTYNGFEIAAMLETNRTEGYEAIVEEDAQTQLDKTYGTSASLAPGELNNHAHATNARIDASYKDFRAQLGYIRHDDVGTAAGYTGALDPEGSSDGEWLTASLSYQRENIVPDFDITANINYLQYKSRPDDYHFYPAGAYAGLFPDGFISYTTSEENQTKLNVSGFYHGFDKHTFLVGLGYDMGELSDLKTYQNFMYHPDQSAPIPLPSVQEMPSDLEILQVDDRENWYAVLQDSWKVMKDWELTAGVRYDNYSDFGSTTNPRLALVWQTNDRLTSKLLYGKAFRAPSLAELFLKNSIMGIGNPDLEPEKLTSLELAFDYLINEQAYLSFNVFRYNIDNQIVYPDGSRYPINMKKVVGKGFETELRWKVSSRSSLLANYSLTQTEDDYGRAVANVANQLFFVRWDWMVQPNWYLDTTLQWVGDRERVEIDSRDPIDDYSVVNLTLRRKVVHDDRWNFAVGVRNVFDTDAREPTTMGSGITYDLPLAGRNWFTEVRYAF